MKLFGMRFAPSSIPWERRLQTMVVMFNVANFTVNPVLCVLFILYLLTTWLWFASVGYIIWMVYDLNVSKTPQQGGRSSKLVRNIPFAKYLADYFPAELVKTADLDPKKNYIFGYHPHGIIAFGATCSFSTEATGFSKKFPGIRPHMLTLDGNFNVPFLREWLLWLGICPVSKESIRWLLHDEAGGNAAVIVVGGAAEALDAHPGVYTLTLARRRGFVRIAIEAGASLVPVFSFGENDLYQQADNARGTTLRQVQEFFKNNIGVSPPMFYGRGVFNYSFGLLPVRTPIHTVVGKPIELPQEDYPSDEVVKHYHQIYMQELSKLFDEHKTKYGISSEKHIKYV